MPSFISKLIGIFIGSLAMLYVQPVIGKDQTWYQYENAHFLAYSDAPVNSSLELLTELERFRTAALQVGTILIPESAPKTEVLILNDTDDFSILAPSKYTIGFALPLEDRTLMVMPVSHIFSQSQTVIRHEFIHALLRFNEFHYPIWYEEGFAELVSAMEFSKQGKSLTIGRATERAKYNGPPLYDWDALVSDRFNPHAIVGARQASSAYTQAWLLVHYTTFGNEFGNAQKLQRYFDLIKQGQSSVVAFKTAFGSSASELWEKELSDYLKGYSYYQLAFSPDALDMNFEREPAGEAQIELMITFLRDYSIAYYRDIEPPSDPLTKLTGGWDRLKIDRHCEDPVEITVDRNTSTITIAHFIQNADGEWMPEIFDFELESSRDLFLLRKENSMVLDGGYSWRLEMRGEDLFCFRRADWPDSRCGLIMTRCSG